MTALRYSVLSSFVLTNPAGNAKSNSRSMRAAVAFGARRRKAPCDDNVRFLKTAVLMRSFELTYLFGAGAAACLWQDAFAAKRLPVRGSAVSRKRTLIEASFPKRRTSRRPISHGGILSLWLTRRAVRRDFARRTDDGSPLFRPLFARPYESRREHKMQQPLFENRCSNTLL